MDRQLVIRAQEGDRAAFAELAVAMGDRLHAVACRMLRDSSLAEDATQQALLQAWTQLPKLRDPERFAAWCYRLLVNVCHAEWRKRKRALGDMTTPLPAVEPRAPDDIAPVADRDVLERGFAKLPMQHRIVVVLRYYADMSVPEIARALGIREGTAKSRLYHAMRGLRAAIEADARAIPNADAGEVIR
jgi:RNA polymerase sigma-70 factor (ECF subfamily)